MMYVGPEGIKTTKALRAWIDLAVEFASALPSKSSSSKKSSQTMKTEFSGFPEETFRFLRGIRKNNNKAWFESHRSEYDAGYIEPAKAFVAALGPRLRKISKTVSFDPKINASIFRINRDVRFSKDKTPYKDHLDLWFWHGEHRGWGTPGFFFRMFADRLILGAGMHAFEKEQLEAYRRAAIAPKSGKALAAAIDEVRAAGYQIGGASRSKVPRGFDPDHERADLLLHEGLWAELHLKFKDEPRRSDFVEVCAEHFAAIFPIARWLLRELA
jgi:uncharacterized protein (TIGR02453 family)